MITFDIIDDKYLKVSDYSLNLELTQLKDYFSKKSRDADFNYLVDAGIWDGLDHFIDKDNKLKIGLWKEIHNFTKQTGIPTKFDVTSTLYKNISYSNYVKFVDRLFKDIYTDRGDVLYPRDYQLEGGFRALKYSYSCEELATSAGKTVIFYIFNSYLKFIGKINKDNKALLIVPNVSLVTQTKKAFEQYNNGFINWNIMTIGGTKNKFDIDKFNECDILITTYQSMLNLVPKCVDDRLSNLIKKPIKKGKDEKRVADISNLKKRLRFAKLNDISSSFSVLNIDEAHKSRGNAISNIIDSCENVKHKLGLSGTLKLGEDYSDFFKMQENIGPLTLMLSAKFLIDNKYSPLVKIKQVKLMYDENDPLVSEYTKIQKDPDLKKKIKAQYRTPKDFGIAMLGIEKDIIFRSDERIEFISRFVSKLNKNTLVLFSDIKNEYGIKVMTAIKEKVPTTFYIDGSVNPELRDEYKDISEYPNLYTEIDLGIHKLKMHQFTRVKLSDKSIVLAKNIEVEDDISDSWIFENIDKYESN